MNCVICLTVRNCSKFLPKIFLNILEIQKLFNLSVIFSCDNCSDNSIDLIKNFKFDGPVYILQNKNNDWRRTVRIAYARNRCLDFIRERYKNTDFHIMMDANKACCGKINAKIIQKYCQRNDWDCLSFNRKEYYDIWALQYEPHIHHCWGWIGYKNKANIPKYIQKDIEMRLRLLKKGELFKCYSAFNGFAIYRTCKFLNIKYNGLKQSFFPEKKLKEYIKTMQYKLNNPRLEIDKYFEENCEHISFHIAAIRKNGAKIRISSEYIFLT